MQDHPHKTVSLQKKLVKSSVIGSVLAGLVALVLLMGITTYHAMRVQDEIMDEIADMLLVDDITGVSYSQLDELTDEFKIQYMLKNDELILSHSENFADLDQKVRSTEQGFHLVWKDQQLWRSYFHHEDGLSAYIVQPLAFRFEHILNTFGIYLGILLILWFIQWGFIHFMVGRQFKSFNLLAKQISSKSADDLAPIQTENIEFEEIQPIIQQLNKLLARLNKSLQAEQRFTSDASHELRSPLSAIQMRLQLLQRKYADQDVLQTDLKQIQKDVQRGTAVLENLLLLARLDPEQTQSLEKETVNLSELIQEVVQALQPHIDEKNAKLNFDGVSNAYILANKQLMFICIRNILDNAVRYISYGGKVNVRTEVINHQVYIYVEDNGGSLSDETVERMGERFYRALGTKTTGSGLGISICKKVIELHKGQIYFTKNEDNGLTVNMIFALNESL